MVLQLSLIRWLVIAGYTQKLVYSLGRTFTAIACGNCGPGHAGYVFMLIHMYLLTMVLTIVHYCYYCLESMPHGSTEHIPHHTYICMYDHLIQLEIFDNVKKLTVTGKQLQCDSHSVAACTVS